MKSCKLLIYSFLPVNMQFTKLSKLSNEERKRLQCVKEYNKSNNNQSLRVKLEKDLKQYSKHEYFFYFSHSYTIVFENEEKNQNNNKQYLDIFFKLMPYNQLNAPIINIEQNGKNGINLDSLNDWQSAANFKIPKGKLNYKNRDLEGSIIFKERSDFKELALKYSIIGSYFIQKNVTNINQEIQTFYQNKFKQETLLFKKLMIEDCAIIMGCFIQNLQQLDTLISVNSYYSDFTLNLMKDLPNLRKLAWINDSKILISKFKDLEKKSLKSEFPKEIIKQMNNLKVLQIQVKNVQQFKDQIKSLEQSQINKLVFKVEFAKAHSLLELINILKDIDSQFQVIIEINSIYLIEGSLQVFIEEHKLKKINTDSIIKVLSIKYKVQIATLNKERSKSMLTFAIKNKGQKNKIPHLIKLKQTGEYQNAASIFVSKI